MHRYHKVADLMSQLHIDEAFLRQLEGEELIHLKQSSEGELVVSFEDAERVRVALMLIGELDVNLAGVEVIMHMREDMLAMQRQVADILDALVDRSGASSRNDSLEQPRAADRRRYIDHPTILDCWHQPKAVQLLSPA